MKEGGYKKGHMRNCLGVFLVTDDIQGRVFQCCFNKLLTVRDDLDDDPIPFVNASAILETAAPTAPAVFGGRSETRRQ